MHKKLADMTEAEKEELFTDTSLLREYVDRELRELFVNSPEFKAYILEEEELLHRLLYGDPDAIPPPGGTGIQTLGIDRNPLEERTEAIVAAKLNFPILLVKPKPGKVKVRRKKLRVKKA